MTGTDHHRPVLLRYDSEYAGSMAQGIWDPACHEELIEQVRNLVAKVCEKQIITLEHMYSHTGQHDNELADEAADRGIRGEVSSVSRRWTELAPPIPGLDRSSMGECRK